MNIFGKEETDKTALPQYSSDFDFDIQYERFYKTGHFRVIVDGIRW